MAWSASAFRRSFEKNEDILTAVPRSPTPTGAWLWFRTAWALPMQCTAARCRRHVVLPGCVAAFISGAAAKLLLTQF